ncbi:fumarate hydratase C-terminal domain-containing protein [Mesorhizobium sp. BE184]|uniref:fumarate hydratase C-terminal domain-containing protein n=1 Tax=Mesorhizobium sp. BE184 TaxID=2817714 RepID=UPI00286CF73F|nr:fumarate hydratase C-terminal domain-containing protein [Mesorhizobium sp. BE184]
MVGETVLLDGEVAATAGLPAHQRLLEALDGKRQMPFPLAGGAMFHLGSSCREEAGRWLPNYVNPTTSTRFDAFMPRIIRELQLTSIGGKGGMDNACVEAMKDAGCVYFSMPGGASPLLSNGVAERIETGWNDLIEQFRLSRFRLDGFGPVTVAIDAHGHSIYHTLQEQAANRLPDILKDMEEARRSADLRRR